MLLQKKYCAQSSYPNCRWLSVLAVNDTVYHHPDASSRWMCCHSACWCLLTQHINRVLLCQWARDHSARWCKMTQKCDQQNDTESKVQKWELQSELKKKQKTWHSLSSVTFLEGNVIVNSQWSKWILCFSGLLACNSHTSKDFCPTPSHFKGLNLEQLHFTKRIVWSTD